MSDLSRRDLFKRAAGAALAAAGAGLSGARVSGQVEGYPGGGVIPLRLPLGARSKLDPKQYLHNMEIISFLPGPAGVGTADGVTSPLWVRGAQRVLLSGVDITDPKKPFVAFKGLPGGCLNYVTHLKKWVVMQSNSTPTTSPTPENPRGGLDKEYGAKIYREYGNGPRGISTYDVTDLAKPNLLQQFSTGATGNGTHANFWDGGRYAYLDCSFDDKLRMHIGARPNGQALMIVDVSDPAKIKEVARWWVPGMRPGEEEEWKKWPFAGQEGSWTSNHGGMTVPKRVEDGGTIGYTGFGRFGMYIMDLTDISKPKVLGRAAAEEEGIGGIPYHSIFPLNDDLIVTVPEAHMADCREDWHTAYVIDVKDKRHPKIIGLFPRPVPPPEAPYTDFCFARGRFGPHNCQTWIAPGAAKPNFMALTEFSAGLQIFDLTDPTAPKIAAYFVPGRRGDLAKWNTWWRSDVGVFVEWDRNLIWVNDNLVNPGGGLYCMSSPFLGKPVLEPRKVTRWTYPHLNAGWDDQTPKAVYFGRSLSQIG